MAYALLIEQGKRNLNSLFDICRWQVKEGDAGVAHEAIADHHLFFYQQAFIEAMGAAAAAIAQASATRGQGGPSNLQRFMAHHPPTFTGGGDPMVADHWFRQVERVLEAMEITSNATRIRLDTFQLEGESQVWWDWIKVSRDLETMTWREF